MQVGDVARLLLGTFLRPAEETETGQARVEAVYGYLVRHEHGVLLLDTGLGEVDAEAEAWYHHPSARGLPRSALRAARR